MSALAAQTVFGLGVRRPPPLPFFMPPLSGESGIGYIARLEHANRYGPAWIHTMVGRSANAATPWTDAQLEMLAVLTRQPKHVLAARLRIRNLHDEIRFSGKVVRARQLEWARLKVCPDCLNTNGCQHALFELSSIGVCPRHRRALVDACQECGTPLTPEKPTLFHCRCGSDLRKATSSVIAGADCAGVDIIARRMVGAELAPPEPENARFKEIFEDPDLSATIQIIEELGRLALISDDSPDGPTSARASNAHHYSSVIAAGGRLAMNWPSAFYDALDKISEAASRNSNERPRKRYVLERALQENCRSICGLKEVERAFAVYLASDQRRLLGPGIRKFPSTPWRRRGTGSEHATFRKAQFTFNFGSDADLTLVPSASRAKRVTIRPKAPAGSGVKARRHAEPGLSLAASARRLGLSPVLVQLLAAEGELKPLEKPIAFASDRPRFSRSVLDALVARLTAHAQVVPAVDDMAELEALLHNAQARGTSCAMLLNLLADGRIPVMLLTGSAAPLARLRFARSAMQDLFATTR